ncbi:arginase [Paenibacillus glycinis]|uniref:Arginase n=1 Tax=Paenibacillus glycinis TaxID=2697035 RepID=A0ABW9XPA8_9BACL|nr:arginase [Paenibacillus glycinis]NBD24472.1 arginase [Paenibacillus glycinis]
METNRNVTAAGTQLQGAAGTQKKVRLIRVPFWLGGGKAGTDLGPEYIVKAGLMRKLRAMDIEVEDEIEVDCPVQPLLTGAPARIKYLPEVLEMSGLVGEQVYRAAARDSFPLILGGDHSVAIGSLAGLTAHYENLGVIWFDAHGDLNTEETTPSGNMHGMALAIAIGKSNFKLTDIPGAGSLIKKENIVIIGARELDPGERELIRSEGIACFSMHEIDRLGIAAVIEKALEIAGNGTDGIHVSFDLDCLDPREAAGVGTPVPGGLNYREAHFALELLSESKRVTSMDIVEVNPLLDYDRRTATLAVELATSLLGKRIL